MGLLTLGEPLSWEDTKKLADHVRQHGIDQFLNLYHQLLDRKGDVLKWGDEVNTVKYFVLQSSSLGVFSRSST
jgi:glutamate--cysteine ligase catalytic subunit